MSRYIDDCDTPADMHGDGPGETLKPGNLDALAGDSTAHPPSIKQTIEEMRAIDADWKNLDDPVQELLDIRYGRARRAREECDARQQRFANAIKGALRITATKIDAFFECRRNGISNPWMPGECSGGITFKAELRDDDEFVLTVSNAKGVKDAK